MTDSKSVAGESLTEIVFHPTPEVREAFQSNKIFFGRVNEIDDGRPIRFPKNVRAEPYASFPARRIFNCGAFSFCENLDLPFELRMGRFSSVGIDLQVLDTRNAIDWVTQSSITYDFSAQTGYSAFEAAHRDLLEDAYPPRFPDQRVEPPPVIEHDVWIGQKVQLARGITVGTGSVIAAGSVVTQDVEPYSVVEGVPARLVRKRFDEGTVARLLASQWWRYHPDILFQFGFADPSLFLDRFELAVQAGIITPFAPPAVTWTSITDLVAPRTVIDTNSMSEGRFCLTSGWSAPEDEFTWAVGPASTLEVPAELLRGRRSLELELFPVPAPQLVEVYVVNGDKRMLSLKQVVTHEAVLKITLWPEWMPSRQPLRLEIVHPNFIVPQALGMNQDDRELSIALRRVTLWP